MRILLRTLFATSFFALFAGNLFAADSQRLDSEMEFLEKELFLGEKKQEAPPASKELYFDRKVQIEDALPEKVVDLDQLYFSKESSKPVSTDSVSTKAAAPK